MTEQEKILLTNLSNLARISKLTADEHKYFADGIQYLAEIVEAQSKASAAQPAEAAPALAAVPSPSEA